MMRLDVGFGDVVVPAPELLELPAMLLDFPPPRLRGYTRESVVAEKLEAMVSLGAINTRYKDYYDIWFLAERFDFDGRVLARAVAATFERRGTPLGTVQTYLTVQRVKASTSKSGTCQEVQVGTPMPRRSARWQ